MGIFIDLSKAFDTINHDILLSKLYHYGIRGNAHKWFQSYLTNRKQHTEFHNQSSISCNIKHGVLQGSILGTLLFLIYVNDFHNSLNHAHAIMYADDTNLFISNKCPEKVFLLAQQELHNVKNWLSANKLSLNTNKTKNILFESNHKKINNNKHQSLYFKKKPIEQVKNILFLGLHLNENLLWKPRMLALFKKLRNISIMYKLTFYLNKTNLLNVYYSLIVSHRRCGITVWNHGNLPSYKNYSEYAINLSHTYKRTSISKH